MIDGVKQFMTVAGVIPKRGEFDQKLTGLYIGLVCEELSELLESQGCTTFAEILIKESGRWKRGEYMSIQNVEALDAMIDIAYVAIGAAYAMGSDVEAAAEAVHSNNMSKFLKCSNCGGSGSVYTELPRDAMCSSDTENCATCNGTGYIVLRDENGKIKKPEGFKSVELDKYL